MACHWNVCFEMDDGEMVVIHSPVTLVLGSTLLIINGSYTTNRHLIDVHQDTDIFIIFSMQKCQFHEPVHLIWQNLHKNFWTDMATYWRWIRSVICWCMVVALTQPLSKMMMGSCQAWPIYLQMAAVDATCFVMYTHSVFAEEEHAFW